MSRSLQSGEVLKLGEVVSRGVALDGKSIRTIGKLVHYSAVTSTAILAGNHGERLQLSTRLLEPFAFHLHSLVQVIGEGEVTNDAVLVIVPRVARCVDGLDMRLHDETLTVWREFLERGKSEQEHIDELPSDVFDM